MKTVPMTQSPDHVVKLRSLFSSKTLKYVHIGGQWFKQTGSRRRKLPVPPCALLDKLNSYLKAPSSPASASEAAPAPVASPAPETPASASGARSAAPLAPYTREQLENTPLSCRVNLPPEPTTGTKFQVREVGCPGNPGKIIGYVWAANAVHAAEKLRGKLVQSCPGWGRVEIPGEEPVEIFWKVA